MRHLALLALFSTACYEYGLVPGPDSTVQPPDSDVMDGDITNEDPAVAEAGYPNSWDPPTNEPRVDGLLWDEPGLEELALDKPWWDEPWNEPPEDWLDDDGDSEPRGLARMTGGGGVDSDESHAFTLHCAGTHHANHMSLSWEHGSFHLEGVDWVTCLDDPALHASQPVIAFDTVVGTGWGRLDGQEVDVWFRLTDDGEPGENDHAWLVLDLGTIELEFEGYLVSGNHQAHGPI
ncbi:MAG: hypothetical protein JRJ84_17300 [Deltaproteobacteria bacterium]|nr:hypothetical protein [Deltaproteobacteria bacterium]